MVPSRESAGADGKPWADLTFRGLRDEQAAIAQEVGACGVPMEGWPVGPSGWWPPGAGTLVGYEPSQLCLPSLATLGNKCCWKASLAPLSWP